MLTKVYVPILSDNTALLQSYPAVQLRLKYMVSDVVHVAGPGAGATVQLGASGFTGLLGQSLATVSGVHVFVVSKLHFPPSHLPFKHELGSQMLPLLRPGWQQGTNSLFGVTAAASVTTLA